MKISTAYLETLKPMVSSMPCNIINAGGSAYEGFLVSEQKFGLVLVKIARNIF